jgi:DNA-binding GntR family transcriptional regulator
MIHFDNITLSQKIAEAIALQIAEGRLKPGERLLENELTDVFGTSRAPIREALYVLEKEGIVERVPRRGVFVKKHTQKELSDLYETVYRLTEITLLKGMELATEKQLSDLKNLVHLMETNIQNKDVKKFFNLLKELHIQFFNLSNNEVLKDLYLKLNNRLTPFRFMSLSHPSSLVKSIAEYKEILKGLEEKDSERIISNLRIKEKRALTVLEKVVVDPFNDSIIANNIYSSEGI